MNSANIRERLHAPQETVTILEFKTADLDWYRDNCAEGSEIMISNKIRTLSTSAWKP